VVTVIQDSTNFANSAAAGVAQTPYPASEYVDLGVKIKATPTLHPNNEVTLLLEFEIRSLAGSSVNGIPVISNRTLTQTVRVKQDEPTLIGGLTDAEETRSITGLPGFAEIPIAGYAFGSRRNSLQDTELLILVTPRKLRLADHLTRTIFRRSRRYRRPRNSRSRNLGNHLEHNLSPKFVNDRVPRPFALAI